MTGAHSLRRSPAYDQSSHRSRDRRYSHYSTIEYSARLSACLAECELERHRLAAVANRSTTRPLGVSAKRSHRRLQLRRSLPPCKCRRTAQLLCKCKHVLVAACEAPAESDGWSQPINSMQRGNMRHATHIAGACNIARHAYRMSYGSALHRRLRVSRCMLQQCCNSSLSRTG